ncbi:ADP-ribosylglycohydrolase family protein [Paraburkholderia kururiensis]|uniref:hypothetical protein n=1 Tax=Paraburkholderia kururiensis TaxID=984307 RepID=UPI0039A75AF3
MGASTRTMASREWKSIQLSETYSRADPGVRTLATVLAGISSLANSGTGQSGADRDGLRTRVEWFRRSVHALIAEYVVEHYELVISAYDVGLSSGLYGPEAATTQVYRRCYEVHVAVDPQGACNVASLIDHLVEVGCVHGRGMRAMVHGELAEGS